MTRLVATACTAALLSASGAWAQAPQECRTIDMSDPGWTDITSTNAIASVVLEALGYEADISTLSVPIGFEAMKAGDVDVFLGNWMPAQESFREDLESAGAIEVLNKNLSGAKYTLAVPTYVAEQGVTDFTDLDEHADKFDSTIYGIESGAAANVNITNMIKADEFGLGDWSLVDSGEQAMLAQVQRAERAEDWIVFLAWAPHPMNTKHDLTYLSGGDAYFGPDFGGAEVYTLARDGWSEQCPNAAEFFRNLTFDIEMENQLMGLILDEGMDPDEAAERWLGENPDVLEGWLDGVTTAEGEPGLAAVKEALGV